MLAAAILPLVLAAPQCQAEFAQTLKTLRETEVDERPVVAIALAAEICKTELPAALQKSLGSIGYADPSARLRMLGDASATDAARADFEAACPAWSKSALATEFPGEKPLTVKVFEVCEFAKLEVMTAVEFSRADVRYATTALVLFDALKRIGMDKKLARQFARVIVLPLEAGPAPTQPDPAKVKAKQQEQIKALMKGDLKNE
ncbi:MAG: hypothetical protein JNM17_07690 [Archangium sp.]|nr:hypothetical protein [Archangium sp.]